MNFNSGAFLIYLPVVVGLYWLLPAKYRRYWLLAASCFFYMYWNPVLILLLMLSTTIDYCCGRGMEYFKESPHKKKMLLMVSICMNLGLLFFFKYFDFFGGNINGLLDYAGSSFRIPALNLILPVGISFYTFQTMSYSIDVYRGEVPAEKDFISFALYVSFFPQLVAGPIENPKNLLPQLKAEHRLNSYDMQVGFRLLLSGFFRKCVVADLCGIYVNAVYADIEGANALAVAIAGALFCIQMYCDFAGYSLIAAGCARLMGIRLMRNFKQPYLSQSYSEFFRRWHISLNRWFTSYVYIPLGGSRKGTFYKLRNTIIVFGLCGLWHGARWTYVLWGLYAAFFVCVESLLTKPASAMVKRFKIPLDNPFIILLRRVVMFIIFIPAALLFRAGSLSEIGLLFKQLFSGGWNFSDALQSTGLNLPLIVGLILTMVAMVSLSPWEDYDPKPSENNGIQARRIATCICFILTIALSWLSLLATQDAAGFAYFQF